MGKKKGKKKATARAVSYTDSVKGSSYMGWKKANPDAIDDPTTIVGQVAAGMRELGATDVPVYDHRREMDYIHTRVDRLQDGVLTLRAASLRQAEIISEAAAEVRKFLAAQADG